MRLENSERDSNQKFDDFESRIFNFQQLLFDSMFCFESYAYCSAWLPTLAGENIEASFLGPFSSKKNNKSTHKKCIKDCMSHYSFF